MSFFYFLFVCQMSHFLLSMHMPKFPVRSRRSKFRLGRGYKILKKCLKNLLAPFVNSWLSLFYRKIKHFQLHNCSCRHSIYVTVLYLSFPLKESKIFKKCQRQNFLMELRLNLVTLSFGCFVGVEAEQTKVAWVAGWGILLNIINQLIKPHSHLIIINNNLS